jgi:8-oxo-dGTP pyrophosphatase MutT (NUDIX family)
MPKRRRNEIQVASIAAFNPEGKLLFGKRRDNGKYTLPGGHIMADEHPLKGAVRELLEETDLVPEGMHELGSDVIEKRGRWLRIHCYAASVVGEPSADNDPDEEIVEFKWVDPEKIPADILDNLHSKKNVTLELLGIQEHEDEELSKGEPLEKMALVHDDATNPKTVYRVQNANGEGPYGVATFGGNPYSSHQRNLVNVLDNSTLLTPDPNKHQPPPHMDFPDKESRLMDQGHLYGFEDPTHAEKWFGHQGLKDLKELGYDLKPVPAQRIYQSKSKKQVLFLPARTLHKGVTQRLWPFNPETDIEPKLIERVKRWQSGASPVERKVLGRWDAMPATGLHRALHKLHGLTHARRNPETGEREFLLHRGMSHEERAATIDPQGKSVHHKEASSWTPHYKVAKQFGYDGYGVNGGNNVISAWIPEKRIATVPNQLFGGGDQTFREEHEIIVSPHTSQIQSVNQAPAKPSDVVAPRQSPGGKALGLTPRTVTKAEHFVEHMPQQGEALRIPMSGTPGRPVWDQKYAKLQAQRFAGGNEKRLRAIKIPIAQVQSTNQPVNKSRLKLYQRMLSAGDTLPPVVVSHRGGAHVLLDGNHRLAAAQAAGHTHINAVEVLPIMKKNEPTAADKFTEHPLRAERLLAYKLPGVEEKHLLQGLRDDDHGIAEAVLKHPGVNAKVLTAALGHPRAEIRIQALAHPHIDTTHLDQALEDKDDGVLEQVAQHPHLREEQIRKLVGSKAPLHIKALAVKRPDVLDMEPGMSLMEQIWIEAQKEPGGIFGFKKTVTEWLRAHGDNLQKDAPEDEVNPDLVDEMHGFAPELHEAFQAAKFLVCGADLDPVVVRRELWHEDGDHVRAALRAYGLEPTEKNIKALHAIMKLQQLDKNEVSADTDGVKAPKELVPAVPEAEDAVQALKRAFAGKNVKPIKLKGKHSRGTLVAQDPKTEAAILIKPGSGKQSPAAGAREDPSTQSQREAAFWHVANKLGLGDNIPRADLVLADGQQWAAIQMLPLSYRNLEKRQHENNALVLYTLNRYRQSGILHRWAVLDYLLGNPDRHAQNLMMSSGPNPDISLIDHGSAFAGINFDPARDHDSFVPFYLRAWTGKSFNGMDVREKLSYMPKVGPAVQQDLRRWLDGIHADDLAVIMHRYGINPQPTLDRLAKLKGIDGPVDEAINRLWVTT